MTNAKNKFSAQVQAYFIHSVPRSTMVESNLSEISSESVRSILNETIEKRLKTKNFEINVNAATKQGDNFIGIVQRVTFNKIADSKDQNGDNHKSLLILKTAPTNLARREGFFSRPCFLREIYLYNEVKRVKSNKFEIIKLSYL